MNGPAYDIAQRQNVASNGRLLVLLLFAASLALWLFRGGDSFMVCALLMAVVPALACIVDMFSEDTMTRYVLWLVAHVLPVVVFLFLLASVVL